GRRRRLVEHVEEADQQLGQALLAGRVQFVVLQDQLDGAGEQRERGLDLAQALLDALGDRDLALAGQQLDRTHLAHVHARRIGGAATLGGDAGQRGRGFLGGRVIDLAVGTAIGEQQRLGIRRNLVHLDAHAVDHADDVLDLLRIDDVVREVIVDFGIGQVALLQTLADQRFDVGLGGLTFVGHTAAPPRNWREMNRLLYQPACSNARKDVVAGVWPGTQARRRKVTGPSLTRLITIWAPK